MNRTRDKLKLSDSRVEFEGSRKKLNFGTNSKLRKTGKVSLFGWLTGCLREAGFDEAFTLSDYWNQRILPCFVSNFPSKSTLEYHKRHFVTCSQLEQKVVSNRLVSPQILVVPTGWSSAGFWFTRVLLSNKFRWKICKSHEITTPHITLTSPGHESNWSFKGHSMMVYQIKIEKIYNQLVSMTGT